MTTYETNVILRAAIGRANKAGMQALERGEEYLTAFDASLTSEGVVYTGAPCRCAEHNQDSGSFLPEDGHLPECGWSLTA